tara:strand:+ start:963 stop:1271 length:309 start_codon:yes stop_codon:yes gene_type:complete
MPTVGDLSFPYTKEGYEAARRASSMLGVPVSEYSEVQPEESLYSNIGGQLGSVFGQGVDNRGGSRIMKSPGLSTPDFNTASTESEPGRMSWQNKEKDFNMGY